MNQMKFQLSKLMAVLVLASVTSQSFALSTYGDPCTTESKAAEGAAGQEAFAVAQDLARQKNAAKTQMKPDLACLDVFNMNVRIGYPSLNQILDAVLQQAQRLVCNQVNQQVNAVKGKVDQATSFPGIPGVPGTGASGGISVGGSGGSSISVNGQQQQINTPGYNFQTGSTKPSAPAVQAAPPTQQQQNETLWKRLKSAF